MNTETQYRGYQIIPKRDFGKSGYLLHGKTIREGFIVTDGACNVMPGATWFLTTWEAKNGIDCLIESEGDAQIFWKLVRAQAPEEMASIAKATGKES